MITMSSIYLKKWLFWGRKNLKDSDTKNSRKRQAKIPLSGDPINNPNFYYLNCLSYLKKQWPVQSLTIRIILEKGKGREFLVISK